MLFLSNESFFSQHHFPFADKTVKLWKISEVSETDARGPCGAHVGCLKVAAIVIHESGSDRLRNGLPLLKAPLEYCKHSGSI